MGQRIGLSCFIGLLLIVVLSMANASLFQA
uniref:Uncharacterized protein n=1 Tax=Rhizophora mucronata TaxID=61149 RepID=A0A2P2L1X8_RHIMU